jgi:flagellar biosynthesis protein FlhB
MTTLLNSLWSNEVRLLPMIVALSIFGLLHLLRKLTAVEYTPSYFAVFPVSLINYQLSEYLGEFYGGDYVTENESRPVIPNLYLKSLVSFFLTFFFVPLLVGFSTAFFLTLQEFRAFLVLLLLWESWHCLKAVYNFASYRGEWKSVIKFFGSFYAIYLVFLFFVIRLGFYNTQPFVEKGNLSELFINLENLLVSIIINILIIGVLSNIFAHWLINKDALKPDSYESNEINNENKQSI